MKYVLEDNYLKKILILSSMVAIALPLYVILFTYPSFTRQLADNIEAEAVRVGRYILYEILPEQTELTKNSLSAELPSLIPKIIDGFGLKKLKVFSKAGEIIYSTAPREIGQINTKAYFHDFVAKGDVCTKVVQKNGTSLEGEAFTADVVETYIPIIRNGAVIGAFEIYYDITARKERFDGILFKSSIALIILAASLLGATIFVLAKASSNIARRKQVENALRKGERNYRLLIDNLPNVVFKGYKDGSIDFIDDKIELLTGYKKDDFNSREMNWFDIVFDEDKEQMRQAFIAALKADKSYIREYRIKTKTGDVLWVQEGSQIVCDESGAIKHVGGAFLDITKHKKLEVQLQQLERIESIGTLAGGLAHDFNNLLMGIQGRASLMLMNSDSSQRHFEHLEAIVYYVESAAGLTRQLLGFAQGGKYEVKATDLNAFIKNHNRMFSRTRKEISIRGKYDKDLWAAEVDPGQIEQVLMNIYVNACQAMPAGGSISVRTENVLIDDNYRKTYQLEQDRYVKISIIDTGVGMDERTRKKAFDPFFTTKEMGRGTGLGLASAYGIVKNHGGFIEVYSEKGKGATFSIYLPASEKEPSKEKELNKEVLRGTETVLVVDDEDIIIDVCQQVIEKLGYEVWAAKSGKEAIDILKKNADKIHLVILDMIMPEMDGGDTYDRLREINPDVKVLLASGYSIDGRATEILKRGCNGFIQKPFNLENLSNKIREVLDKNQMDFSSDKPEMPGTLQ